MLGMTISITTSINAQWGRGRCGQRGVHLLAAQVRQASHWSVREPLEKPAHLVNHLLTTLKFDTQSNACAAYSFEVHKSLRGDASTNVKPKEARMRELAQGPLHGPPPSLSIVRVAPPLTISKKYSLTRPMAPGTSSVQPPEVHAPLQRRHESEHYELTQFEVVWLVDVAEVVVQKRASRGLRQAPRTKAAFRQLAHFCDQQAPSPARCRSPRAVM